MDNKTNNNIPREPQTNKKNGTGKRSKKRIITVSILLVLLVTVVAVAVYGIYMIGFHEPDNESGGDNTKPFVTNPNVTKEPSEIKDPEENPLDKSFNFLLVGRDQTSVNTDVMMLINYNVSASKFSFLQIPRDTYVELNNTPHKINSLYYEYIMEGKSKNEKNPEDYSLSKISGILEQNLCINIHYYVVVNLEGFRNIVDILGGVEVDVPADMDYDDESQDLHIHIKKGKQVLDGKTAEGFVRFRSGYIQADIGRMDAQKIFMSALLKTMKEKFNISTVVKMANEVYKNVMTSIPLDDMVYFAKNVLSMDMSNIKFMSLPGSSARSLVTDGLWYYVLNRKATMPIIQEYFNIYSDVVVDDSIFDPNGIFTSTKIYPHLNKLYTADTPDISGDTNDADDINQGAINIPRY